MLLFKPIKYALFFFISYLLLSFPVNQKPLFSHLYNFSRHATQPVYGFAIHQVERAFENAKELTKKLFFNAKPNLNMSSHNIKQAEKIIEIQDDPELEQITDHEREMLTQLLSK
jgi:hypothetical protein